MKKHKRALSLVLALVMALALLPTAALADEPTYTELTPFKYDIIRVFGGYVLPSFHEGLAAVRQNGKWGFVDTTGKEVVPFQYGKGYGEYSIPEFHNGYALLTDGDGRIVILDKTGKELVVLDEIYECDFDPYVSEDRLAVYMRYGDHKYGYVDAITGKEIAPCIYDDVKPFCGGLAAVGIGKYGSYKYGVIDATGKEIVPCIYDNVETSPGGLISVRNSFAREDGLLDDISGLLDATGKEIVPYGTYDYISGFHDGLAVVRNGNRAEGMEMGVIDTTGKVVVPFGKYFMINEFSNGLARVISYNYGHGFINTTGKEIIPVGKYDSIYEFSDGLSLVFRNGQWGIVDATGKETAPLGSHKKTYDWMYLFSGGLARVQVTENGKTRCGAIDATGREVIPFKYGDFAFSPDGFAGVKDADSGEVGVIDTTGKAVVPFGKFTIVSGGTYNSCVWVGDSNGKCALLSISGAASPNDPAAKTAYPSTQTVDIDGKKVEFQMYALKDANGYPTNYIKARDLALALNNTKAQFAIEWDGKVNLVPGKGYTPNGSENKTPFSGERAYTTPTSATNVNGSASDLTAIFLTDDNGGGYTYYQLRDLGKALGFNVGWSGEKGAFIETDKPYDPSD